ncbi:hypothetical protein JFT91_01875 [Pseudomonas sp. TH08]|uniref:hypothetical protein n=2 Tax=unclassified Pseudomonas TaxID=196821 RepID=UPI001913089E|nr:hypothetical protein [Pseudomonas sp. TH06]MBK5527385.1 hypothetical protein [Pseudomonas sp. TH06]MBK5531361.1 hypothetical protein [Pseudomonas sp. TH08]
MSPKIPRKPPATTPNKTENNSPTTRQPGINPAPSSPFARPVDTWPHNIATEIPLPHSSRETPRMPAVVISELPGSRITAQAADNPFNQYWLRPDFLRGLQDADAAGFRFVVGRRFVDIEHEGALHTAHVEFDATLGTCQVKLLTERDASGPLLVKNPGRPTWRLASQTNENPVVSPEPHTTKRPGPAADAQTDSAAKQPRVSKPHIILNQSRYRASAHSPDGQGYYHLEPALGSVETGTRFAFMDRYGNWIQVDPPSAGFSAQPTHLKHWTDQEIWEVYDIQGADIGRFRVEAQTLGKPPLWAEVNVTANPAADLLRDSLRWLHPALSPDAREALLQSYNLLPSQLLRLRMEMKTELQIPQWAETHKQLTADFSNPQNLTRLSLDLSNELNLKRGARHDWYHPETSLTTPLREALLARLGYRRNKHDCLYRTDVPALFRGDDRTPFELANDDAMLPRYAHKPGAATLKPISATFSLKEGLMYASAPDPEYLQYNSQTNKYPGRSAGEAASDSSSSDSSDSDSSSSSSWSDTDDPVSLDNERNYVTIRERQTEMFIYALDTRTLEVVPHEENHMFNSAAREQPQTWFPDDDYEGLISVSRAGLPAERIWLLNSTLTKGAKVQDITEQAGNRAESIEAATHAGRTNKYEYDQLIDEVAASGKPILLLSGNKNEYADDIVWPET